MSEQQREQWLRMLRAEQERRLGDPDPAAAAAAWEQMLAQIAEMGQRFAAVPFPGDRALAERLAQAEDWPHLDGLRTAADLSRAEAVALVWTISPEVAERLLCAYFELRSGSIEGA